MVSDLGLTPQRQRGPGQAPGPAHRQQANLPLKPMVELEREALVRALEKWNGNRTKAAEELGVSRRTILNKIKQHGLSRTGDSGQQR